VSRICLYYRPLRETDRWVRGDRHVRPLVRRLVRGPERGGVPAVFANLRRGLDRLGQQYVINPPFRALRADDRVGVLGRGRDCLAGYDRPNPIVAGIALMTHPSEWPTLCDEYPVVTYLQHSQWAADVYRPYFGDRCKVWPVGIDTHRWRPSPARKSVDFLVYEKFLWEHEAHRQRVLEPALAVLRSRALTYELLRCGTYTPREYAAMLARARAMLFLSPHESQGIAYQECLSSGVPVLAWDQRACLDPNRFAWGTPVISATSVPYFDERCGMRFSSAGDLPEALDAFLDAMRGGRFAPRDYVLETLTLERGATEFVRHLDEAMSPAPAAEALV